MMFNKLRRLAAAIRARFGRGRFNPPMEPYAGVRQPRPAGPGGRHSAVAILEPEPPRTMVRAIGKHRGRALTLIATAALLTAPLRAQTTTQPQERPFVSAGRIDLQLSGGEYQIRSAADNRIRVTLTRNPGTTKVDIGTSGSQATVKVTDTPHNNFSATIEVPKIADLTVHLTGGDITISGVTGNKDVECYGGNVTIIVPNADEYSSVNASVKAGDIDAPSFGGSKSGLLQTFTWSGRGKYKLRATLGAGNLELKNK
jgi:hypothetical protein